MWTMSAFISRRTAAIAWIFDATLAAFRGGTGKGSLMPSKSHSTFQAATVSRPAVEDTNSLFTITKIGKICHPYRLHMMYNKMYQRYWYRMYTEFWLIHVDTNHCSRVYVLNHSLPFLSTATLKRLFQRPCLHWVSSLDAPVVDNRLCC